MIVRVIMLLASVLVFFAAYQFGREHRVAESCSYRDSRIGRPAPASIVTEPPIVVTPATTPVQPFCDEPEPHSVLQDGKSKSLPKCASPLSTDELWTLHLGEATVPSDLFSYLHHPASPAKHSYVVAKQAAGWSEKNILSMPCAEVTMTRTGSRASQPNKCVSVVTVPEGHTSGTQISHRVGTTANNHDQYQKDFPRHSMEKSIAGSISRTELELLPPLFSHLDTLLADVREILGNHKSAVVMVANEGVLDLLLNFVCSAEAAKIDLASVIVYVGDSSMVRVVEAMGIHAYYNPVLGAMPSAAANAYLDHTFSRMMWFKAVAVYLTLMAGYDVLFQDVDLVWLLNPLEFFSTHLSTTSSSASKDSEYDLYFMDDGARTPRYTPFFGNSGFYYVRRNERTVYMFEKLMKGAATEIAHTHSHQSVLIRHMAEAVSLFSLRVFLLNMDQFPSGQAYHENKPYIREIQARKLRPFVFHMCWTDNRHNKLVYFKDVGLWYLPEDTKECAVGPALSNFVLQKRHPKGAPVLLDSCCQRSRYWPPPTAEDFEAGLQLVHRGEKKKANNNNKNKNKNNNKQNNNKNSNNQKQASDIDPNIESDNVQNKQVKHKELSAEQQAHHEARAFFEDDPNIIGYGAAVVEEEAAAGGAVGGVGGDDGDVGYGAAVADAAVPAQGDDLYDDAVVEYDDDDTLLAGEQQQLQGEGDGVAKDDQSYSYGGKDHAEGQ